MTDAMGRKQHVPDILDCLAQLSNDEVPTPPKLARAMLDLLPVEVWSNPDYRWVDPCCKSGAILREVAARLLVGLKTWQPDFDRRREHIFRNMLFGTSVTTLTGQVARRSVYCSRDASSARSVVRFDTPAGNLPFLPANHDFGAGGSENKCIVCGAPADLERGRKRENYAYAFIHGAYPTEEMSEMKFDVIVGNPPYQLGSSGGQSVGGFAMPVYQKFIEMAIALDPHYLVMITPSRWFAGGRNMGEFRDRMLADKRLRKLMDYPNAAECFPGNEIKGGVSYFLWDRSHHGLCEVATVRNGKIVGAAVARDLGAYDVLVRYNIGVEILRKVWPSGMSGESLATRVSPIQPFSIRTNVKGKSSSKNLKHPVILYRNGGIGYIAREQVPRNVDWIDQWKVLLGRAYGAGEAIPHQITNRPIVAPPGSVCTETYLVIDRFGDRAYAEHLREYLSTRFVRFLVSLRKNTQDIYNERFAFVPLLPMNRAWTDEALYKKFKLTTDEIAFIESQVREMPAEGKVEA